MATATMSSEEVLSRNLISTRTKLNAAESELADVVREIRKHESDLAAMQEGRQHECEVLAKNGKGNPERFDRAIQNLRDRLSGLEAVKRGQEREVSEARASYDGVEAEVARLDQQRAIETERRETEALVLSTRAALKARDEAERVVIDNLVRLRGRTYLSASNKSFAFDQAFSVQRNMAGMR